jgi:hypothetical protein
VLEVNCELSKSPNTVPLDPRWNRSHRLFFQDYGGIVAGVYVTQNYRPEQYDRYLALLRKLRALQRGALLNLRNHNQIGDETMRKLEYELDLVEAQYSTT